MGAATGCIQVGTWTANIYVRHSYTCARGAALIADATDRRFVLGLGVSHPPVNQALGIDKGARDLNPIFAQLHGGGMPTHQSLGGSSDDELLRLVQDLRHHAVGVSRQVGTMVIRAARERSSKSARFAVTTVAP